MNRSFAALLWGTSLIILGTILILSAIDDLHAAEGDMFTVKQVWFYDYRHIIYFPVMINDIQLYCYDTPETMYCREGSYAFPTHNNVNTIL